MELKGSNIKHAKRIIYGFVFNILKPKDKRMAESTKELCFLGVFFA